MLKLLVPCITLTGLLALSGCRKEGCLGGDDAKCVVPSPCPRLQFSCGGGYAEARVLQPGDKLPGGPDALAAPGDILLGNDRAVAVIDALNAPHHLGPSGGNLLDLGNRGLDDDTINDMITAVGILPGDAVLYDSLEILSAGPELAAVQVRGHLAGRPGVKVATRYEARPCEPGIRVRSELVNLGDDDELWTVMDGYYWNGSGELPFTPSAGDGFHHDPFSLVNIEAAYRKYPFLAYAAHQQPTASYAEVACNADHLEGFNADAISTAGLAHAVVPHGDHQVFERFLAVAPGGPSTAPGADVALEVRRQLFGDKLVTLQGRVVRPGGFPVAGRENLAAVTVSELPSPGAARSAWVPWTEVVPEADGTWQARVPANKSYALTLQAFGREVAEGRAHTGEANGQADDLVAPLGATVRLQVMDPEGAPLDSRVVVVPADAATRDATSGRLFGNFEQCTPFLGNPVGASPACNQVLVRGSATVEVPAGHYHVYATAGPFYSLAHREVQLTSGGADLTFVIQPLDLQPPGTVSADLHVHGRASPDSSLPDYDRVLAMRAARLDVIAATDHDVVQDYSETIRDLGLAEQMSAIPGDETTGQILWMKVPGSSIPKVIGHYNFWPLKYDPSMPRRGAPDDEQLEPGQLFSRLAPLFTTPTGLIELNHPWANLIFGRDLGYPRAVGLDCTRPLPQGDDGTGAGMFVRTPANSVFANNGHHAQEVMNGSQNDTHLAYRALWFCFLDQGLVYTGTANSDSHALADNVIGTPRNLVWADTRPGPGFDVEVFDKAVRDGHVLGTNGPVLLATVESGGQAISPSVKPFTPAADAQLHIVLRAAPWVWVREVRVLVNGKVKQRLDELPPPQDPFGSGYLDRLDTRLKLSDLLAGEPPDSWIVVEAGEPLLLAGDLDHNGIPDTTDNNHDGKVDSADVQGDGATTGPLANPDPPGADTDPRFPFYYLNNQGYPQAFTNPFLLDRDGKPGFQGPGLPPGGP